VTFTPDAVVIWDTLDPVLCPLLSNFDDSMRCALSSSNCVKIQTFRSAIGGPPPRGQSACLSVCLGVWSKVIMIIIINNHDDIYSALIMTEVIARVHSVHLVNVEQRQAATDPQTPSHLTWAVTPPVGCYHL